MIVEMKKIIVLCTESNQDEMLKSLRSLKVLSFVLSPKNLKYLLAKLNRASIFLTDGLFFLMFLGL